MKKVIEKVNQLPTLVKENLMSIKEALDFITIEILKNKNVFYLNKLTDEELSDLIIYVLQNGSLIFEKYNDKCTEFYTYLSSYLHYQYLTIKREKRNLNFLERTYLQQHKPEIEEHEDLYENQEYYKNTIKFQKNLYENHKFIKDEDMSREEFYKKIKELKISKKAILILALKYINYIKYDLVSSLAEYCNLSKVYLQEICQNINNSLHNKQLKQEEVIKKRDKAFYLKRKYQLEICLLKENNVDYSHKEEKLKNQNKYWINKIEQLKSKQSLITPSNNLIAKELGLKERTVSHYLNKVYEIYGNL